MQSPIDYYTDANQQKLYTIEKLYGVPDFVKSARVEPDSELQELRPNLFADLRNRRFPCHNKSATWLAQAYFCLAEPSYSKKEASFIQDCITGSAKYFGISELCNAFRHGWSKVANTELPGLSDNDYALVDTFEGRPVRRFPIHNPISVKRAAEYLFANRFKYPYEWRKMAARNILKRTIHFDTLSANGIKYAGAMLGACKFDLKTQEYLERASGYGMSLPRTAGEKVAARVLMISDREHPEMKVKLAQLAKALGEMEIQQVTPELYQKMAAVVDGVDRETGLCNYYHEGVDMPEDIFFDILQKQAEAVLESHVTLMTGNSYPVALFQDMPLHKISSVLGVDFADAVSDGLGQVDAIKFAEIARTLPRPDAALLECAINAAVKEAELTKAARAGNMSNEPFTKESIKAKLKAEGRRVVDTDFDLTSKIL